MHFETATQNAGLGSDKITCRPDSYFNQEIIEMKSCFLIRLFMAALRSRCGQRPQIGCLPFFHTCCDPSANLECRSEMCCTRLAGNRRRKNDAKNRHLRTIAQVCRAISSQLRHASTIGKKIVKQQYLPHMFLQYGELRPTSG